MEHVVAAHLIAVVGEPGGVGCVGGGQHQGGRVHRARGEHDDVAGPGLLALSAFGDHGGGGLARRLGLHPHGLAAGEQGDVSEGQGRLDGAGARVALGLQQAGVAAAGLALDAGRGERVILVPVHAQRHGEGAPALALEMRLELLHARIVADGGIGVWR